MIDIYSHWLIWGAGTYGRRLITFMKNELLFKAVIDNDPAKQGGVFEGVPVISFEQAKTKYPNSKIVIAQVYPNVVRDFLFEQNYKEYEDFVSIYDFIPRWYKTKYDKLVVKVVNFASSNACTLACENCQSFIPHLKQGKIYSTDDMITNADLFFKNIDSVFLINVCLGESFLNKELSRFIKYIFDNYRERYGFVCILTNGTIVPSDSELKVLAECNATISISDYTGDNEKIAVSLNKLIQECKEYGVDYYLNTSCDKSVWFDYGNPEIVTETNPEKLEQRYISCFKPGTGIRDGLLYLCQAQNAAIAVAKVPGPEICDYYDLRQPLTPSSREELYKIISRDPDTGYISHCARCNGTCPIIKSVDV